MSVKIEQVHRQDPDFLKHVYRIRRIIFHNELKFPPGDRHVYNEWDALSNHYLFIHNGTPSGVVSVIDWSGLTDILINEGIDPGFKVAKVTKLAMLSESRSVENIKKLVEMVRKEILHYDFVTAHVSPPSDNPYDPQQYNMGRKYQKLFGLEEIHSYIDEFGVRRKILGREIPKSIQLNP